MSLPQEIAEIVAQRGQATIDDVQHLFPNHTRDQLLQGFKNARRAKLIFVAAYGKRTHQAQAPAIHCMTPPPPKKMPLQAPSLAVPSVFALAGGGVSIPQMAGTRYQPLGGWTE